MFRKVFEEVVEYQEEDGGQALIATISNQVPVAKDLENGMFVRVQSWETEKNGVPEHKEARSIQGKRVRITIEEI